MRKNLSNFGLLVGLGAVFVLVLALACTTERVVEVPTDVVVTQEVIKEVQVPGETVVVTQEVIKEVQVPGETIIVEKVVVKEVQVPGETIIVEKEVIREVQVPGETIVVTKEVIVIATAVPALPGPVLGSVKNVFGVNLPVDAAPVADQYLRLNYPREGEAMDFAASVYNSGGGGFESSFSLAMLDTNLSTSPGAAVSWETSDDLMTWTFNIDPDLNWSDGMPVTADDFVYTWQYYADPEHAYDFAWYFGSLDVVNWGDVNAGTKPLTDLGVEAVDAKTLVFKLDQPAPYVPGFMMYGTPLAKHQAEAYGPYYGNTPATAVSMTPWILEEWIPNQHSVFVPNVNYNGKFKPFIERIKNVFGERDFDAYLAGEIDSVNGPFSPADQELLMRDAELLSQRGLSPGDFRTHYLFFDFQNAPFNDVRVRQAFAKAIDRPEIMKFVVGEEAGRPSYGILIPGFPDAVAPEDLLKYQGLDVAAAQQLMSDAGFRGGAGFPTLEMALRSEDQVFQDIAAAVAGQLKANIGVDVTINNMTRKDYMAQLNGHNLQFAMVSYGFDYVDASNFLSVFKTQGRHNWDNAEFEALRIKAAGNADPKERAGEMRKLQEILSEDVGSLFLWNQVQNQLHKPYLKGTWRLMNAAGWQGLQYPNWSPGFGVQNIYTVYIGENVKNFTRSPF